MEQQRDMRHTLWEKIKDVQFGMLTTYDPLLRALRSRPMTNQQVEFDGTLWFFISDSTAAGREVLIDDTVNISYADPGNKVFVSVSGTAEVLDDHEKAKQLWNPLLKAWFPQGLADPTLRLLKVSVSEAEYWDSPSSTMVQLYGAARAMLTGESAWDLGEHQKLNHL